jgi:hypothetical protein
VAGRNKWLLVLVAIWFVWWLVSTVWSGADLARNTIRSYITGSGQTRFISDGRLAAALGNPDAHTLTLLPAGVGLAPGTPTARIRPTITYEASNSDITVHVPPARIRITLELTGDRWHVAAMDILP